MTARFLFRFGMLRTFKHKTRGHRPDDWTRVTRECEFPSLAKEGPGVVRSTSSQICSDVDPTTPSAPSKEASRHFIDGAATPPLPRGKFCLTSCVSRWTCGTRSASADDEIGAPVLRVGNRQ